MASTPRTRIDTLRSRITDSDDIADIDRDHLLRDDHLERVAYAYCSPTDDDRLLVEDLVLISDEDTVGQSRTACRPIRDVELGLVHDCLRRGMHPLIIHSHPFDHTDRPQFSLRDDDLMNGLRKFITGHEPAAMPMFAVVSQTGITATIYPDDGADGGPLPVTVIGNQRLDTPLANTRAVFTADTDDMDVDADRFDRGILALGEAGQARLANTHVAVIGCGGLGDLITTELAMYGVGAFTLVDPDVVEASNLPRLISAADHHVDRPKVDVTKQQVWRQNPRADVTTVHAPVEDAADALHAADLIEADWTNAVVDAH